MELYELSKAIDNLRKEIACLEQKPYTPCEAALAAEIGKLPVEMVKQVPAEQLAAAGLQAGRCHYNTTWFSEHNPADFEPVVGWMVMFGSIYHCHSVIRYKRTGCLSCITPGFLHEDPDQFEFRPDPAIKRVTFAINGQRCFKLTRPGTGLENVRLADDPDRYLHFMRKVLQEVSVSILVERSEPVARDRHRLRHYWPHRPGSAKFGIPVLAGANESLPHLSSRQH